MTKYNLKTIFQATILLGPIAFILINLIPEKSIPAGSEIDRLVVWKSKRELVAYSNGKVIKTYRISLGRNLRETTKHPKDSTTSLTKTQTVFVTKI